jgi:transcriptional regulator with XRE-family HTH domain
MSRTVKLTAVSEVGAAIRRTRKVRRLSLPELATAAHVGRGTLSKIENGSNLTIKTLYRLAAALEVTPSSLIR